jgi:hypothetical protein
MVALMLNSPSTPTTVFATEPYFGDHDPSGVDITRAVEEGLREFAPDAEIHFERVAVTRKQIGELNLPTRPTKRQTGAIRTS